jgi:hypothetical protein
MCAELQEIAIASIQQSLLTFSVAERMAFIEKNCAHIDATQLPGPHHREYDY